MFPRYDNQSAYSPCTHNVPEETLTPEEIINAENVDAAQRLRGRCDLYLEGVGAVNHLND